MQEGKTISRTGGSHSISDDTSVFFLQPPKKKRRARLVCRYCPRLPSYIRNPCIRLWMIAISPPWAISSTSFSLDRGISAAMMATLKVNQSRLERSFDIGPTDATPVRSGVFAINGIAKTGMFVRLPPGQSCHSKNFFRVASSREKARGFRHALPVERGWSPRQRFRRFHWPIRQNSAISARNSRCCDIPCATPYLAGSS